MNDKTRGTLQMTVAMLISLNGVAWVIALVEAGVAAIAATTGVHVSVMVRDRLRHHGS